MNLVMNEFRHTFPPKDPTAQDKRLSAAHTRKANTRADLGGTEAQRIIRSSMPFGPEVSAVEAKSGIGYQQQSVRFRTGLLSHIDVQRMSERIW